jgi:hypothetical protein
MSFPNDADGDALQRLAEHADMSKPMQIDYAVDVPSEAAAREVARRAARAGFECSPEFDETDQKWTCYCAKIMVPTYEGVVGAQVELNGLSAELGGSCDSWGSFGE